MPAIVDAFESYLGLLCRYVQVGIQSAVAELIGSPRFDT